MLGTDEKLMLAVVVPAVDVPTSNPVAVAPDADKAAPVAEKKVTKKRQSSKKNKIVKTEKKVTAPAAK